MKQKNHFDPEANFDDGEKVLNRLDPAWAKAALYFRTGLHFGHSPGEIRAQSLIEIHEELEAMRKRFEAGESMELLHAIKLCGEENLPMPTWLTLAFNERFTSLGQIGGSTSLDAIFTSKNMPKGTPKKAAVAQQDWHLGGLLWSAVWDVANKHSGLDTAVDEILKEGNFGVKKTTAKRLINMIDKNQNELAGSKTLSQFWAIRRNSVT